MSLVPFYYVDVELAGAETRVLNLTEPYRGVPPGVYDLVEYFCPDPACDCRRGMLNVIEDSNPDHFLASISYAFDRDEPDADPFLDPLNPQSRYAPALLAVVEDVVFSDASYLERLERHYNIMKAAAANPAHPAYQRLQHAIATDPDRFVSEDDIDELGLSLQDLVGPVVGRNTPCPCGSGRKYKHCCGRPNKR